jgi:hypothetical protein
MRIKLALVNTVLIVRQSDILGIPGGSMATSIDPKQVVSFEELLLAQVVQQEALSRLLIEKGVFTKEQFLEMEKMVDRERRLKRSGN